MALLGEWCYVILRDGERRKGFFWCVLVVSALYGFFAFPLGLLLGGALIAILLKKRKEFFQLR
jgi:ABC-type sugar transport system permease subunit